MSSYMIVCILSACIPTKSVFCAISNCLLFFSFEVVDRSAQGVTVKFGSHRAVVSAKPLKIDVYNGDDLVVSTNARGLLKFEQYRSKPGK